MLENLSFVMFSPSQYDDCIIPCKAQMVMLSGKNMEKRDDGLAQAFFYFPPRIIQNREKYFYSFISLVAEIGGYVGLLLGVSLFHLARLLNGFLDQKILQLDQVQKVEDKFLHPKAKGFAGSTISSSVRF